MKSKLNDYKHFKGNESVLAINLAAGLSTFFFGYGQDVMSGVNLSPDYVDVMRLHSNDALLGGVVAVYYVGTLIGSFISGWIGDRIGCIKTVTLGCDIGIFGAVLQTCAQNVAWMICSRIITGVGTGFLNTIVPVCKMIPMEITLNILGIVVAYWLAYGLSFTEDKYDEIVHSIKEEAEEEPSYFSMVFIQDKLNIPRHVFLLVLLQNFQQLTGIGVTTVYVPQVFQSVGFSTQTSQLLSGINNITYMLSTLVAVFTLDKWGRRFTLLYGAIGQGVSLVLIAILNKPENMTQNLLGYGIGATVFTFLYTAFFGMTWLTVPWLYPVEIYLTKACAKGGAWSAAGWSVGKALVTEITPPMIAGIGLFS